MMNQTPIASVTKRFEFDAAHRLPNHDGLCRNIHGHRYALEVSVRGPIINDVLGSNEGMIIDFQDLKSLVREVVIDVWDHALLLGKDDPMLQAGGNVVFQGQRLVLTDYVPTAENMALDIYQKLSASLKLRFSESQTAEAIAITKIRLYETPTTWVDVE